mgnify:CR=1 FL=1
MWAPSLAAGKPASGERARPMQMLVWYPAARGGKPVTFNFQDVPVRTVLQLIAEEPRHGYDLIKAIEELTGGDYAPSPGAVYPTLQLLADEGLIEEDTDDTSARKPFRWSKNACSSSA